MYDLLGSIIHSFTYRFMGRSLLLHIFFQASVGFYGNVVDGGGCLGTASAVGGGGGVGGGSGLVAGLCWDDGCSGLQ